MAMASLLVSTSTPRKPYDQRALILFLYLTVVVFITLLCNYKSRTYDWKTVIKAFLENNKNFYLTLINLHKYFSRNYLSKFYANLFALYPASVVVQSPCFL
jgi:hypothetical protein